MIKKIEFSGIINDFINLDNSNYLSLSIIIGNYICHEFICLKVFNNIKKNAFISFSSKDIKVSIQNNKNYIEILIAKFKSSENSVRKDIKYKIFNFDFFKFCY